MGKTKRCLLDLLLAVCCVGLGFLLPWAFQWVNNGVQVLLLLQLPVLLCGMLCGPAYGLSCGLLIVLLPQFFPGIPGMALSTGALWELAIYGFLAGLFTYLLAAAPRCSMSAFPCWGPCCWAGCFAGCWRPLSLPQDIPGPSGCGSPLSFACRGSCCSWQPALLSPWLCAAARLRKRPELLNTNKKAAQNRAAFFYEMSHCPALSDQVGKTVVPVQKSAEKGSLLCVFWCCSGL